MTYRELLEGETISPPHNREVRRRPVTCYPLRIFCSEEDKGFIAEVPDLPGCSAWGAEKADAAPGRSIACWLEAARGARREIPAPSVSIG